MDKDNQIQKLTSSDKDKNIGNLIHAADKLYNKAYNDKLKELDLTLTQALVLLHVYSAGDEYIYQKNIEEALGLTNPTVTTLIKTLIKKDLIYKVRSEDDGRYFHLHLTPKSTALIEKIPQRIYDADASLSDKLSKEEQQELIRLISVIIG